MNDNWFIQIFEEGRLIAAQDGRGPVVLGRQDEASENLFECRGERLVIAERDEDNVSRRHIRLQLRGGGRVAVQNVSKKVPISVEGEVNLLEPGSQREFVLPLCLALGKRVVRVQINDSEDDGLERLPEPTIVPGSAFSVAERRPNQTIASAPVQGGEGMIRWFQTAMEVLQSAANSTEFYMKAARGAVELVELDSARVLLLEAGGWKAVAAHAQRLARLDDNWQPSRHVVDRVRCEKRTFWQSPSPSDEPSAVSLIGVQSIVASPILDREGDVIGVLYGERRQTGLPSQWHRISKLEAMLVELFASGVAAGLARLKQEQTAIALGQFFTPELAQQLAANPKLLEGHDAEISVLFCDIRGFSRITDELGPARTHEWLGDVLGVLSDCVLDHQGVLVDYVGDELMAMWGAPESQPDHAELACHAALQMLSHAPELSSRWEATLGHPMGFGIGIDTGVARVGNTGSRRKFKYGPLGNTVNQASRVQGANKYFNTDVLITAATRTMLGPEFRTRRVGKTRVLGMSEPLDLSELVPAGRPAWEILRSDYESALDAFEACDFRGAAAILGPLVAVYPDDGPSLLLMSRTAQCLVDPASAADLAFRLSSK
jgi:adenylate cyclase